MLVDEKPPLDEDLLMHFGIKGMHWGVRKTKPSSTPAQARKQAIDAVKVKQSKLDASRIFNAYMEAGNANSHRSSQRRIAQIEKARGKKMGLGEAFDFGASRAKRDIAVKAVLEMTAAGALMGYGVAKLPATREVKLGATVSAVMLTGRIGAAKLRRIGNFREADKAQKYAAELRALEAKPKKAKGGKRAH